MPHDNPTFDAEALLRVRRVFDIDHYGWLDEDDHDPEFVGYAMWTLNAPYEHDFIAWQDNRPPLRAATDQERTLMTWDHDFFGLMKTARHFIGQALIEQPNVKPLEIEATLEIHDRPGVRHDQSCAAHRNSGRILSLTGERNQAIESAIQAPEPREPRRQTPARQEVTELLFDEARQSLSVAQMRRLRAEGLEMVAHQLVQGSLLGPTRLIGG